MGWQAQAEPWWSLPALSRLWLWCGVASPDRHLERVEDEVGAEVIRELPTIMRECTSRMNAT